MMRLLINANVFGWRMTGLMPKGAGWFFGFSRRPKEIAGEPRLVSYAPDGETCTLNFDGEEHYYDRIGTTANVKWTAHSPCILEWRHLFAPTYQPKKPGRHALWSNLSAYFPEWMAIEHGALKVSCHMDVDEIPHL